MSKQAKHLIVIVEGPCGDYCPRGGECLHTMTMCLDPAGHYGWDVCEENHASPCTCTGTNEDLAPCSSICGSPPQTFHDVEHTWRFGIGWTTPTPYCEFRSSVDELPTSIPRRVSQWIVRASCQEGSTITEVLEEPSTFTQSLDDFLT